MIEGTAAGRRRRSSVRAATRLRTEIWGIFDQGLVSGVNFLTIVLVARAVAPAEFGYFVLAFTLILTALTLQAALITRPHNVLGAVRRDAAYANYTKTAAAVQLVLTATLGLFCAFAAGVSYASGFARAPLLLALAPALVAWQLQEFGRRVLYTERRLGAAFANDLVSYGGQAAALLVLWRLDLLTAARALLTLAAAFAIGAGFLSRQLRVALSGKLDTPSLLANWHFGKWLGVAEIGQWFATQFYIYLAAALLGSTASAALKAGQTLLGPIAAFLAFFTSYLPVVFARELQHSGTVVRKTTWSLVAIFAVVIPYCLLAGLFAKPLLEFVYGPEYGRYSKVVELFALFYVVLGFSTVAVAVLSARGLTRDVFLGQLGGATLSLALGWLLLEEFGPAGGVVGMLASWICTMALFLRALRSPAASTALP